MHLLNSKINTNRLFTPSALLAILFFTYQVSILEFKNSYDTYSFLLAAAIIAFALKSYILTFASLEKFIELKKWVLFLLSLLLFSAQSWIIWLALKELTVDSYPRYTIGGMLVANLGFYLQLYIIKVPSLLWVSLASFVVYALLFILLLTSAFNSFVGNSELLVVFQQFTGYVSLFFEVVMLFLVGRYFVKK